MPGAQTAPTPTALEYDFALALEPQALMQNVPTSVPQPATALPGAPNGTSHPPALVAQQIAAALNDRNAEPGQPIELALDPPELGRVRMQLVELSGVMTLTIHAERPETAELMRRHMDLLSQEFAEAGIDAPSVHISQDGADAQSDGKGLEDRGDQTSGATDAPSPETLQSRPVTSTGAMDLRL